MAKLGFANLTSLLFSFLTISNIIYNKQSFYDQLTSRNNWNAYYDYIIVGGGTAGSVLAARLTEDPEISVLVIEAGGSETVTSNTPGLSETLIGTVMDWKWMSVPQNNSCLAMNGQQCHLASGRVIGGTSSINRMYYLRGHPNDFDHWESKFGLKFWSWKDVFPYIIRNENQKNPDRAKSGHYGLNGPIFIEQSTKSEDSPEDKILESFLLASKQFGYRNVDLNVGVSNGSSILPSTIHQGKRQSMSTAFLEPNFKKRPNLHVLANSVVVKILFDGDKAIGIKFHRDWQQYSVFVRQEVIVSAGALHSPHLLMLSGIGPRSDLNRLSIPVIADLPVGENLHDHVGSLGLYFVTNNLPEPGITKQHLKQYFYYGKGPLAESRYAATVFRSKRNAPNRFSTNHQIKLNNSPDSMLLTYVNGLTNREFSAELTEQQINLKRSVWNSYYGEKMKSLNGKLQFTILPVVLKPKSRGTIRLKSTNPFDMPMIDPSYLNHPDDLNQMVQAMRQALRVVRAKSFEQYRTEWYRSVVPGCEMEFEKFEQEFQNEDFSALENELNVVDTSDSIYSPFFTTSPIKTSTTTTTTSTTLKPSQPVIRDKFASSSSSSNLPYFFVSSLMSKLFRKSASKNGKVYSGKRERQMKSTSNLTSADNLSSFYYDQYWMDQYAINSHPLINKTIYGGLIDGFSSSGSTSLQNNFDQSPVITVWSNHGDHRKRTKPPTQSNPTPTPEPELPPDVSPIVLTGYFQSPPKPLLHHQQTQENVQKPTVSTRKHHPYLATEPSVKVVQTSTSPTLLPKIITINHIDKYLKCVARMMTMPLGDYVGTCRMGSKDNGNYRSVVDERFRVHGIRNLRVIDNSVVPEITTGGLAPVAIMLGERGAEFIREERKQLKHNINGQNNGRK